ncbi:MAG: c-type cytochrome [Candidatus Poribacteria bacterium]|nr:c-type cytochrome [Candidatus Poribacteria bacterium]
MKAKTRIGALIGIAALLASCGDENSMDIEVPLAGGDTTVFDASSHAYSLPAPNLDKEGLELHLEGDAQFEAVFVTAPAEVNSGLGPLFNSASCVFCHPRDGRAPAPMQGGPLGSALIRLSLPDDMENGGAPTPVPGYGGQLNDRAIINSEPEATVAVHYRIVIVKTADGRSYELRVPEFVIQNAYTPLPPETLTSLRMPRPVFGLGLLEAVSEEYILSLADEQDADGDGISGKPNYVTDVATGRLALGRFGWKANQPSLRQQTAAAYHDDMGVTTSLFPRESSYGQLQSDDRMDDPEISDEILDAVTFYIQTLAVPARRNVNDPQVRRGERLFTEAQCSACHVPKLRTGVLADVPEVSNQTIYPYTDMLLHDMGPELADGRPDYAANGYEWRTPPLWGIGLSAVVNGHTNLLHDGRARSVEEAILWHGGEAEAAREMFKTMPHGDRAALVAFVLSL